MTGMDFITSVFCDAWSTSDDPGPMTPALAAYTMREWEKERLTPPPTVTPVLFSGVWNILRKKYILNK